MMKAKAARTGFDIAMLMAIMVDDISQIVSKGNWWFYLLNRFDGSILSV